MKERDRSLEKKVDKYIYKKIAVIIQWEKKREKERSDLSVLYRFQAAYGYEKEKRKKERKEIPFLLT